MNHISIEGMDGVGKSTTCKLLAEKLGYEFVEKPLHYLLDDSDDEIKQYQKVAKRVNSNSNRTFTAWYYGLNNIYLYEEIFHIILDNLYLVLLQYFLKFLFRV